MKRIVFILLSTFLFFQDSQAQIAKDSLRKTGDRDLASSYLQKAKTQKTIGWILLGTGVTFAIIGASQAKSDIFTESSDGIVPLGIATLSSIASVPFFISAGKKKRKAEILLSNQNIPLTGSSGLKLMSVGIAVPIRK